MSKSHLVDFIWISSWHSYWIHCVCIINFLLKLLPVPVPPILMIGLQCYWIWIIFHQHLLHFHSYVSWLVILKINDSVSRTYLTSRGKLSICSFSHIPFRCSRSPNCWRHHLILFFPYIRAAPQSNVNTQFELWIVPLNWVFFLGFSLESSDFSSTLRSFPQSEEK